MGGRILIVDDEKNIRLTVKQALMPLGYEVETAMNGEEALQSLEERDLDVMLLDLKMPGMNGMEVLRRVAHTRPDVRVIIVTAFGTVENAVEAMRLGAVDFIQKPFSLQEIRELVRRVMDRPSLDAALAVDYQSHLELARRAVNERHFNAAVLHAKKAIGADPSRAEAYNFLGALMELLKHDHEAKNYYRAALDLDPTYAPAKRNLERSTSMQPTGSVDLGDEGAVEQEERGDAEE